MQRSDRAVSCAIETATPPVSHSMAVTGVSGRERRMEVGGNEVGTQRSDKHRKRIAVELLQPRSNH